MSLVAGLPLVSFQRIYSPNLKTLWANFGVRRLSEHFLLLLPIFGRITDKIDSASSTHFSMRGINIMKPSTYAKVAHIVFFAGRSESAFPGQGKPSWKGTAVGNFFFTTFCYYDGCCKQKHTEPKKGFHGLDWKS